ncbi:MAG TPA: hypothetical protein PLP17_14900, partial [Oligoflexia bacterium]|nr:hypothetical protein [Oligoflexia bacterium]
SAGQVARAILFSGITYWLGFFLLTGLVLLIDPPPLPSSLSLPSSSLVVLGLIFIAVVVVYVLACALRTRPLRIRRWEWPFPSVKLTLIALIIAAVDWMFATSVNYVLLPVDQVSFIHFAGVFLIGQVIGILSHVPGGLGVYETMLVFFLGEQIGPNQVLGCLIAYRIIYYLVPVCLSMLLLLNHEIREQRVGRVKVSLANE